MSHKIEKLWAIDLPKTTDYLFSEFIWAMEEKKPTRIFHNRTEVQNQSIKRNPSTAYACTCFSLSHCVNEANAIAEEIGETSWELLWDLALKRWAIVNWGWSLQWGLTLAMEQGLISGYTKCMNVDEVKSALLNNQLVYTWRNKHCFSIFGYDDDKKVFICKNSYGPNKFWNGYFTIPYLEFSTMFTKYAIVDKEWEKAFTEKRVRALQSLYSDQLPSNERRWEINTLLNNKEYKRAYDLLKFCLVNEPTFTV